VWNAREPAFLPSGRDLAEFLADEAEFPSDDAQERGDLAKVTSYYVDVAGRPTLRDSLRGVLNREQYKWGSLHEFLAEFAPPLIVVTNYDTLLEQAFLAAKKAHDLVVYPADRKDIANSILWWPDGASEPNVKKPNELDIALGKTTVIYKMHRTVVRESDEWDSFVITEEDYVEFLSRMTTNTAVPALFYPYFRERSFLFLG
jgi:SIR2-like domain